jgi:putative acetyltransferase
MLLFIGGAARTGKGMLVRRLLSEERLPFLSLDVLKMGLTRGVPEYVIDPDAGAMQVAERLWPLVREMSRSLLADHVPYVIEGELLPKHVAALRDAYQSQVYACFLGYCVVTPQQKLHEIRTYAGFPNDWSHTYTDAALLPIIAREIAFSQYICAECHAYHLPYFDISQQFAEILDQVVAYVQMVLRALDSKSTSPM